MTRRDNYRVQAILVGAAFALGVSSCDRMVTPPGRQIVHDADVKMTEGNFAQAINLYEQGLDGSPASADVHFKLGTLYDDKMSDPLNAVHHFKRYIALAPTGRRAADVKSFIQRDEVALLTSLSGDSIVTRAEAARLRNENLALRKELEDQKAKANSGNAADGTQGGAKRTRSRRRRSTSSTH